MQSYNLWGLVILDSLIFLIFAFSFTKPKTKRDWRSFGAFSAFIVALFTEMYGFPLTLYLLSGWLTKTLGRSDVFSHNNGHLWETIFGWKGDPHMNPLHLLSYAVIFAGFVLLAKAWAVLYQAQRSGKLATSGIYAHIRHPQYMGFIAIMFGFLLQWPTLITLAMFPILVVMYRRLALSEEKEMWRTFGDEYARYVAHTPAFLPRLAKTKGVGHERG